MAMTTQYPAANRRSTSRKTSAMPWPSAKKSMASRACLLKPSSTKTMPAAGTGSLMLPLPPTQPTPRRHCAAPTLATRPLTTRDAPLPPPPAFPSRLFGSFLRPTDKHADADPPGEEQETKHPPEPYIKLGRLAVLAPYRSLGLAKLLVNAALDYAMMNPDLIYRPPSPTALEMAQMLGNNKEREITWQGLVMIHAQANLQSMWEKHGFHEELRNDNGEVEIPAEPHWIEEGIEHVGMWKRLSVEKRKRLSLSSLDSS